MDFDLKKVQEIRRNECRKVVNCVNSVDFTSLDDREIRALVMIRELGNGIVNRQRKLATDDDVSRVLKLSIETMVEDCRKIVDQISMICFLDFSEREKKKVMMIQEIAHWIIAKQDLMTTMNRHRASNREIEREDKLAVGMLGHSEMEIELADKEELAVGEHSFFQERQIVIGDKEDLAIGELSDMQEKQVVMQDKEELTVGRPNDLQERQIVMLDKEGLVVDEHRDLHDLQSVEVDKVGVLIDKHSDLEGKQIVCGEEEGLAAGERNDMLGRHCPMEDDERMVVVGHNDLQERCIAKGDQKGMGAADNSDLQDIEIVMEHKEGMVVSDDIDIEDVHVGMDPGEPTREPISWPLNGEITQDWIVTLMETFKWLSWNKSLSEFPSIMPLSVVTQLINKASNILCLEPNFVNIQCNNDTKVVVVGDLRGQYLDLLNIWENVGFPSEKQLFLFTGNYVDRGKSSLELFLVLLAWKAFLPHKVYLLRGNHESSDIAEICGFLKEVNRKFPEHGHPVYQSCLKVFSELPLASVIADCVYMTHGGLFRSERTTTAQSFEEEETRKVKGKKTRRKRRKMTATLSLGSLEELAQVNRFVQDLSAKDVILTDVLWSDPTVESGLVENKRGDAGLLWGPDCTESFLKQTKLKMIIRSHEGPDSVACQKGLKNMLDGHCTDHEVESGKLYTLFSAPDYPQHTSKDYKSKGAYAVLEPPHFDNPEFFSFEARKIQEVNVSANENTMELKDKQVLTPMASNEGAYFAQQSDAAVMSSGVDIGAVGLSTPPSWIISLADDVGMPVQISEASKVEGSPLPSDLQEPHKSNHEYLLNIIGNLKKEIKEKEDELDDYKRKHNSQSPSPAK